MTVPPSATAAALSDLAEDERYHASTSCSRAWPACGT